MFNLEENNMKRILTSVTATIIAVSALTGCNSVSSDEISVISRESGSGTRGAFVELLKIEEKSADGKKLDRTTEEAIIANKTDVMITNVSNDINAIGYISLGSLDERIKAVRVDGVQASMENVKNGTYKVARPFNIATKAETSEVTQDFIGFILSAEGQEIVADGYIPIDDAAAPYAGTKPSGKVVVSGSSSVTPVMEKLKEGYEQVNPSAEIEILMSDSTTGMTSAIDGTCDIGMASRDLSDKEKAELTGTEIALDGIAIVVNNENAVESLTSEQIKEIYTGAVVRWSELD